jgi:YidC/Oxa1 family membrane protein insertase
VNIFDLVVVQPIFNLLIGLYSIIPGGDFGVSLILFTILVRFALYPLVKRQLHQTQAMKKLQPELARIKKQAKGNKQLEGMQMMELYKKHGVNPFRSIGILLIQLPIFIALYQVIQIFTLHRDKIGMYTYSFMDGIGPIKQLIEHPNQFNEKLLGFLDLTKVAVSSHGVDFVLLTLAIIAAVTQYVMSKQTMPHAESKKRLRDIMAEAAEGKQADQAEMNAVVMGKMMKFLPFMMFFIMMSLPGALALYYTVSNLVAVAQQSHLLKQDEDELEVLADKTAPAVHKKATAKARAKVAKDATITRIKASPSPSAAKED